MNIRLQTRHTLTFLGLLAIVLAVLSGALLIQFRSLTSDMQESSSNAMSSALLEKTREAGLAQANFLATALRAPVYQLDFATIGRLSGNALDQKNAVYVFVFDNAGRVVHDGTLEIANYGRQLADPETESTLKSARSSATFDETMLHVSVPVVVGSNVHGGVRIGFSTDSIRADMAAGASLLRSIGNSGFERLLLATLIVTVLLAIVGVFASLLLARNMTRPIRILSDLARRVGRGEYDVDVPIKRRDEVGDLAHSFKEMAEELARAAHRNALLATFVEHVGDAIEVVNTDAEIEYTNPAHERITGYTLAEAIGRTPAELHRPKEHDPAFYDQIWDATASGQVWKGRMLGQKKDGSEWHQDATISPVRDEKGEITHFIAIKRDATADIAHQQALADSKNRFKDFAEASSDWMWEIDENLQFILYSGDESDIGGWGARDALGKTRWQLYGVDPDKDEDWGRHKADLEARQPFRDFRYEFERDGKTYHVSVNGNPYFDANGRFKGYRGTAWDRTAEVESDIALQESEGRFKDYAEASSDWLWELDENLRFVAFTGNRTSISGQTPEDAVGKTRWELFDVDPETDESWGKHKADLEAGRPFRDFRYEFHGDDGKTYYLSASGRPIFDENGDFKGYRGTACDMTAEVTSELALRESEEQRANIAANLPGRVFRRVRHSDGTISYPYVSVGDGRLPSFEPDERLLDTSQILERIHPDDRTKWSDVFRHSAETLEPFDLEYRRLLPSGESVWMRAIGRPHRLDNGDTVWDGISLNVTDRKEAESALNTSEQARAAMLAAIPDPLFSHDKNGVFLDYHSSGGSFEPLVPPEVFLGRTIREVMPTDLAEESMKCIEQAIETGETQFLEYPMTKKGKNYFYEARYVASGSGEVLAVVRDVTARKRAEEALQASELRFRRLDRRLFSARPRRQYN